MSFGLTTRLMTLTCYNFEFSQDFADLGANNGYTNRPVLSATEL